MDRLSCYLHPLGSTPRFPSLETVEEGTVRERLLWATHARFSLLHEPQIEEPQI